MITNNVRIFYRVVPNRDSNDFNNEPENVVVPYDLHKWFGDKLVVNRSGWSGEKHRQIIENDKSCFETKIEAEKYLQTQ